MGTARLSALEESDGIRGKDALNVYKVIGSVGVEGITGES